jgi:hypothetical protein
LLLTLDPAKAYVWMGLGNYGHPLVLPMIVASGNDLGLFVPTPTPLFGTQDPGSLSVF